MSIRLASPIGRDFAQSGDGEAMIALSSLPGETNSGQWGRHGHPAGHESRRNLDGQMPVAGSSPVS